MVEAVSCSAPTRKVLQRAANNRDSAEKVVARSKVCFQGKAEVGPEANFANSVENDPSLPCGFAKFCGAKLKPRTSLDSGDPGFSLY
jgi:hypothetical protein